jgi:hypothetical protein
MDWLRRKSQGTWALSRYEVNSLTNKKPTATVVKSKEAMIFGIVETYDGNIWFGTPNGAHRFDGYNFTDFNK